MRAAAPLALSLCALWLCVLSLSGCVPRLQGDGFYGCEMDVDCPSSAPFCHDADHRCHVARESADGGTRDAGPPGSWNPCPAPEHDCAGMDHCIFEPGDPGGYCAPPRDRCPSDGVEGPGGACRRVCTAESDCAGGTNCTRARWQGDEVALACAESAAAYPESFADECPESSACMRPLVCINRRCMRPCDGHGDELSCARGEICAPVPDGDAWCVVRCEIGGPDVCPTGTSCQSPGAFPICLPSML